MIFESIADYKYFLLDMDGTIYLGNELFPETPGFLEAIKKSGGRYIFLTNNSSKDKKSYISKLAKMGIAVGNDGIYSSGDATAAYLNGKKPGALIYVVGTLELCRLFADAGFRLSDGSEFPDYVVLGFDITLDYKKIQAAHDFISGGAEWICTHPDIVCPAEGGRTMPDAGAMIELFAASTGKRPSKIIGKPNREIIDSLIESLGIDREKTVMVGDRLYTDIAVGAASGIASCLVLTGETSLAEYEGQSRYHADFVFDSVGDIAKELNK